MATHSIVILGGSFAGLTVASNLLRDIIPSISKAGKSYKVTVINPSEEFFWKIGAPRTIVNPDALPLEKTLLPIKPHFSKYTSEQFELVKAYASSIDSAAKTVSLSTGATIHYDSLVICSGTGFNNHLWSTTPGTDALKAALKDIHERLPNAKDILVGGGGAAGVETAGELGERFGNSKNISLISGTTQLLNRLQNKSIGADAERRLKKMGVQVIHKLQVASHRSEGGKEYIELSDGTTKTVDVYIEAIGDKPNTSFVPEDWLNERKQVKTDPQTLRLDVPGVPDVYVYGTVASYSDGSMADIMFAKKAILESLRNDLSGQSPGPRAKNVYKKMTADMQFVPIGSQQGVGTAFGWKIPSFVVKMAKSKDFMIGNAVKHIEGTA